VLPLAGGASSRSCLAHEEFYYLLKELSSEREYELNLPCMIGRSMDTDLIFSDPTGKAPRPVILRMPRTIKL